MASRHSNAFRYLQLCGVAIQYLMVAPKVEFALLLSTLERHGLACWCSGSCSKKTDEKRDCLNGKRPYGMLSMYPI